MNKYRDIINLPHFEPKHHKRASKEERASQFGAFRALTGHEESIEETARLTEAFSDLGENKEEILNRTLIILKEKIKEQPEITIMYFIPDEKKEGGKYVTVTKNLKKIDEIDRKLIFTDKSEIMADMIAEIEIGESI